MKIWIDVTTGKQLLFAEPIIKKLEKNNSILCTARDYRELNGLIRIRRIKAKSVGRHGGGQALSKLICSAKRIEELSEIIYKFQPNLAISFQSPEAARVAFGLGIRHIGFADSAHASAVMKLTVPYLDILLIPWIMKKEKFARYGISERNILKYRTIDAAVTCRRNYSKSITLRKDVKTIIIRMAEEQASYNKFPNQQIVPIISQILQHLPEFRIVALPRYPEQISFLRRQFGNKIRIIQKVADGVDILRYCDVFIGSGGTMTAEAVFLGIPTISYSGRHDYEVDAYLERKNVIVRESNPKKIPHLVRKTLKNHAGRQERVKKILDALEDPFTVLQKTISS